MHQSSRNFKENKNQKLNYPYLFCIAANGTTTSQGDTVSSDTDESDDDEEDPNEIDW